MNSFNAPVFTQSSKTRLQLVPNWARLPSSITLDRVIGVAVDSRGFIYLAHRAEHPLLCLNPDGTLCREVGADVHKKSIQYDTSGPVPVAGASRYWLHGLSIDPWDNVWVTDVCRHLVMKFDPNGKLLMTLGVDGKTGCDGKLFDQPTHVCVVPSGEFFVTDGYGNSRIAKFSGKGEMLLQWGQRGTAPGEFHTPHVIVLGTDGLLYMSDRENDRVQVFDQSGKLQAAWPGLHSVDGLYAGPDGFIYGSSGVDGAFLRMDRAGRLLDVWEEPAMGIVYPHAVAVGADGAVYGADGGDKWVPDPASLSLPRKVYQLTPKTGPQGGIFKYISRPA